MVFGISKKDDKMNRYFELAQVFATIAGGLFVAAAFFGAYTVSSLGNILTVFSQQITLLISKDFPRLESIFNSTQTTMDKINDDFFRAKQYESYFFVLAFVFTFLAVFLGIYGFLVDRKQERKKSREKMTHRTRKPKKKYA
jgi:nitrate reductase NapE component